MSPRQYSTSLFFNSHSALPMIAVVTRNKSPVLYRSQLQSWSDFVITVHEPLVLLLGRQTNCRSFASSAPSSWTIRTGWINEVTFLDICKHLFIHEDGCPFAFNSSTRRWARTSGEAVMKNFSSAFGNTTVPMSLPSMTTPLLTPSPAVSQPT